MSPTAKRISIAALLVIIAFFPSLFAELSSVDDLDMYKWLLNSEPSLKQLFFPQHSGGAYYRPLIGVSYLFDKYVWFLDTRLMHLDNLLFHLANALLVYYLAFLLVPRADRQQSLVPFVAAVLFGVHPLTTESVAWISGRTDIMAGTFVLACTAFLLKFRETRKSSNLLFAFLALIPGMLIKETPLAFLPGALFILLARKEDAESPDFNLRSKDVVCCVAFAVIAMVLLILCYSIWPVFFCGLTYLIYEFVRDRKAGKPFKAIHLLATSVAVALPPALFFIIRKVVFTSNISSVGRTINLIVEDLNYAGQTFFGAAGFYVRKFFFPFPLNFAIREIDPLYNAAGVAVFFLCLYAIRRRSMNSALFLSGICLFLPALPLSLGTITWTAYAERYIYMSTAFWALAISLWAGRSLKIWGFGRSAAISVAGLLIVMEVCTLQRSMVWRSNLELIGDTVKKSPSFKLIRVDYMTALIGSGDLEGAKIQYKSAQTIPSVGYMEALDINMAAIHVMEGKNDDAEQLYLHVIEKTRGKSAAAYDAYMSFLQKRYVDAAKNKDGSSIALGVKLIGTMEKLYHLNKDPSLLYRAGQLALYLERCDDALRMFTLARNAFPPQGDYARISARLADQLASGRCRQVPL